MYFSLKVKNMQFLEMLLIIGLGLCMGSFVTMASYRFSLEGNKIKYLLFKRSHCIKCKNELGVRNLIPVFSWIFQKGKCSFCQSKISIRYPLIEIFCLLSFLLVYYSFGAIFDVKLIVMLLITTALIIATITDLEGYFIPDSVQIILFFLAVIYHLVAPDEHKISYYFLSFVLFVIFGLILHYGFLFFAKKDGIGMGDVKFFAIVGLLIGASYFAIFMFLSGVLGIVFGLVWQKITKDKIFPFAPALITSLMICLLVGKNSEIFNLLRL